LRAVFTNSPILLKADEQREMDKMSC
jgi:hypothetical protein